MARYTVTRRNENSSYLEPVSITLALSYEELQTFTDALRPTGDSECIIQQLLDLINPPREKAEQEWKWIGIKAHLKGEESDKIFDEKVL